MDDRDEDLAKFRIASKGKYVRVPGGDALRAIGKRDQVHPRDVFATLWTDRGLAEQSASLNTRHFGHRVYGPVQLLGGILIVVDFSPTLARFNQAVTDPALAD